MATITGDNCNPSDNNDSFSSTISTSYDGNVTAGSQETFYFRIETAGKLVLTINTDGNKAYIAFSESGCPTTTIDRNTTLEIEVKEPTDINILLEGTGDRAYTLIAEFTPLPIGLIKTNYPAQVKEGIDTNVTYTLTAINYGGTDLTGIVVSDTLPAEVTSLDINTTANGWECNLSTLTCTGNIDAGDDPVEITINATVHPTSTGNIINTALMTTTANDKAIASSVLISVDGQGTVDLEIQKFSSGEKVEGEDYRIVPSNTNFVYAIFVTNHSQSADADIVKVTDIFPGDENITYVSYNSGSGWICDIPADINGSKETAFSCYFNRPMGHEITYFTITAHTDDINQTLPATTINEANVTALNPITGGHDTNASATILIKDINGTGGGSSFTYTQGGVVEVSDISLANGLKSSARIQTKVAASDVSSLNAYYFGNGANNSAYTPIDVTTNNQSFPLRVIFRLTDDTCSDVTYLAYEDSYPVISIFEDGDLVVQASEEDNPDFQIRNIAMRKARLIMKYIDINEEINASGLKCSNSNMNSNLKGIPQCFNSGSSNKFDNNKFLQVFGVEAFVRCIVGSGEPCNSNNHGYSCGPNDTSCIDYNELYDHDYGCYECIIGGNGYCSQDNFAIRPKEFDVNISDGDIYKSGKDYRFAFKGLTEIITEETLDYNETQDILTDGTTFTIDLNVRNNEKCQVKDLNISPNVSFHDGLHEGNFSFSDIGDINMSIHETNTTEFAKVDVGDTPIENRFIEDFNVTFTVIPDHFDINATLTDHNNNNSPNNFTYLHDINEYDIDDNYSMSTTLTIDIKTMGADNTITRNYTEQCYAKDTNLTLDIVDTNITFPGSTPALTQFLYYNPIEDDDSNDSGEGNYSFPTTTSPITITALPIENTPSTFPADPVNADGNGTTHIEYKLNFDRKIHLVVNPFKLELSDVNISEVDANITDPDNLVKGETGTLPNQSATMYYARTRSSQFFYDDVTDPTKQTPILIDVYCNLGFTACGTIGINTVNAQINENNWWLSLGHDENNNDGNITLEKGVVTEGSSGDWNVSTDVTIITSDAIDPDITVNSGSAPALPLTVEIELDNTLITDTNYWLIYNPNTDDTARLPPSPFYKVRFIGVSGWAGHGDTGHVVDSNASTKKNRRLGW